MNSSGTGTITKLLHEWKEEGDEDALEELMPLVYSELEKIARSYSRGEEMTPGEILK